MRTSVQRPGPLYLCHVIQYVLDFLDLLVFLVFLLFLEHLDFQDFPKKKKKENFQRKAVCI